MLTHTPMESHETHPIVGVALAECTASDSWWKRSMHVGTSCYRILNKGLCTVARSHHVGEGHDDSSLWSVGIVAVAYHLGAAVAAFCSALAVSNALSNLLRLLEDPHGRGRARGRRPVGLW